MDKNPLGQRYTTETKLIDQSSNDTSYLNNSKQPLFKLSDIKDMHHHYQNERERDPESMKDRYLGSPTIQEETKGEHSTIGEKISKTKVNQG